MTKVLKISALVLVALLLLMMAFIGLVVGGMVVALYLPMFRGIDLVQ